MPKDNFRVSLRSRMLLIALLVYSFVLFFVTWKHTFWRDETECWLLARDSHSLLGLLHNVRYQGHPPGWYFVLYVITFFTANPEWMKLPNYLFSVASAGILLYAVRLPIYWKLGFLFSYFLFFEYSAIDRNYAIGFLFLLWAAVSSEDRSVFKVPILLSLAVCTSLPAIVVAVCMYQVHVFLKSNHPRESSPVAWLRSVGWIRWGAASVFALVVLANLAIIRPPADSGWATHKVHYTPREEVWNALQQISKAYIPIPAEFPRFWNTSAVDYFPAHLGSLFGCLFSVAFMLYFHRRVTRCFFGAASLIILFQMKLSGHTFMRHVGWLFLIFVLAQVVEATIDEYQGRQRAETLLAWRPLLLSAVLSAQVVAGVIAVVESLRYRFSASKDAVVFLRQQHLDDVPMIVMPDYTAESILAYLQKPGAFYTERHGSSSFIVWDMEQAHRQHVPSREEIAALTQDGKRPVLILEQPLSEQKRAELGVTPLASFAGQLCSFDEYYLYR